MPAEILCRDSTPKCNSNSNSTAAAAAWLLLAPCATQTGGAGVSTASEAAAVATATRAGPPSGSFSRGESRTQCCTAAAAHAPACLTAARRSTAIDTQESAPSQQAAAAAACTAESPGLRSSSSSSNSFSRDSALPLLPQVSEREAVGISFFSKPLLLPTFSVATPAVAAAVKASHAQQSASQLELDARARDAASSSGDENCGNSRMTCSTLMRAPESRLMRAGLAALFPLLAPEWVRDAAFPERAAGSAAAAAAATACGSREALQQQLLQQQLQLHPAIRNRQLVKAILDGQVSLLSLVPVDASHLERDLHFLLPLQQLQLRLLNGFVFESCSECHAAHAACLRSLDRSLAHILGRWLLQQACRGPNEASMRGSQQGENAEQQHVADAEGGIFPSDPAAPAAPPATCLSSGLEESFSKKTPPGIGAPPATAPPSAAWRAAAQTATDGGSTAAAVAHGEAARDDGSAEHAAHRGNSNSSSNSNSSNSNNNSNSSNSSNSSNAAATTATDDGEEEDVGEGSHLTVPALVRHFECWKSSFRSLAVQTGQTASAAASAAAVETPQSPQSPCSKKAKLKAKRRHFTAPPQVNLRESDAAVAEADAAPSGDDAASSVPRRLLELRQEQQKEQEDEQPPEERREQQQQQPQQQPQQQQQYGENERSSHSVYYPSLYDLPASPDSATAVQQRELGRQLVLQLGALVMAGGGSSKKLLLPQLGPLRAAAEALTAFDFSSFAAVAQQRGTAERRTCSRSYSGCSAAAETWREGEAARCTYTAMRPANSQGATGDTGAATNREVWIRLLCRCPVVPLQLSFSHSARRADAACPSLRQQQPFDASRGDDTCAAASPSAATGASDDEQAVHDIASKRSSRSSLADQSVAVIANKNAVAAAAAAAENERGSRAHWCECFVSIHCSSSSEAFPTSSAAAEAAPAPPFTAALDSKSMQEREEGGGDALGKAEAEDGGGLMTATGKSATAAIARAAALAAYCSNSNRCRFTLQVCNQRPKSDLLFWAMPVADMRQNSSSRSSNNSSSWKVLQIPETVSLENSVDELMAKQNFLMELKKRVQKNPQMRDTL
ncbi:AF4/FMR2 family member 4-like [Cyclospora cayetanensis]|uniref:AF4/FMR2 family member 4-like n=1 Tax=Cyclospora cayetanensis TaxID=88456 RepID=A0A6P6S1B8_9EIME|nr:AF4/FMR2 family member 4-like [Cyclospora cayetanensis]